MHQLVNKKNFDSIEMRGTYVKIMKSDISDASFVSTLMMEMELVSETMDFIICLTRLSSQEDLIKFCRPENFQDE